MPEPFHYYCGSPVRVGDRVQYSKWNCIVEMVIEPRTEDATAFHCPDTGGVLLAIPEGDKLNSFLLLTPPDREQWEDLEFKGRAAAI